jgi:choline transport protein
MTDSPAEKGGDLECSPQHSKAEVAEVEVTVAGHAPELGRSFNLLSACATGITTGNAWAVLGGGIVWTMSAAAHVPINTV